MRRLAPHLAPLGYSPRRYAPLSPAPVLGMGERLTDLRDIQQMFANGEQGGYWPADPAYAYEDSAGTTAASVNVVVGLRLNAIAGYPNAVQATTGKKPYLRLTPTSNKPWYDSNTSTGALNVTFASALGRRNLITYTEAIGSTSWSNIALRVIVQLNNGLSPLNTLAATKLIRSTTVGTQRLFSVGNVVPISATYTVSVYAKAAENYQFALYCSTGGELGQFGSIFNLSAMTATGSGVITPVGDNWYRCSVSGLTTATDASLAVYALTNTGSWSDAGNNVDGMYFWGAQLEPGTITDYQKIVAGPSAVLDPAALAATYPQNISASTNCTIACVTPEGVVIADNQTVGTTFNIAPAYGYNSDVLIINRALTAAEIALVKRVMQRSVPTLGSELVIDGEFNTPALWTTAVNASVAGGLATFSNAVNADGSYVRSTNTYSFSATGFYKIKFLISSYSSGLVYLARSGYEFVATGAAKAGYTMCAFKANSTTSTQLEFSQVWNGSNLTASIDSLSIQAIL